MQPEASRRKKQPHKIPSFEATKKFSESVRKLSRETYRINIEKIRELSVYSAEVQDTLEFVLHKFVGKKRKRGDPYPTHYNDSALRMQLQGHDDLAQKIALTHDFVEDSCAELSDAVTEFLSLRISTPVDDSLGAPGHIKRIYSRYGVCQKYLSTKAYTEQFDTEIFAQRINKILRLIQLERSKDNHTHSTRLDTICLETTSALYNFQHGFEKNQGLFLHTADHLEQKLGPLVREIEADIPAIAKKYQKIISTLRSNQPEFSPKAYSDAEGQIRDFVNAAKDELKKSTSTQQAPRSNLDAIEKTTVNLQTYVKQLDKPLINYGFASLGELVAHDPKDGRTLASQVMTLTNFHDIFLSEINSKLSDRLQANYEGLWHTELYLLADRIRRSKIVSSWQEKLQLQISKHIDRVLSDISRVELEFPRAPQGRTSETIHQMLKRYVYSKYLNLLSENTKEQYLADTDKLYSLREQINHLVAKPDQVSAQTIVDLKKELEAAKPTWFYAIAVKFIENFDNIRTLNSGNNPDELIKAYLKEEMLLDATYHYHGKLDSDSSRGLDRFRTRFQNDPAAARFFTALYSFKKNSSFCELLTRCIGVSRLGDTRMYMEPGHVILSRLYNYGIKYDIGGMQMLLQGSKQPVAEYSREITQIVSQLKCNFTNSLQASNLAGNDDSNVWQRFADNIRDANNAEKYQQFWETALEYFKELRIDPLTRSISNWYTKQDEQMVPLTWTLNDSHRELTKQLAVLEQQIKR